MSDPTKRPRPPDDDLPGDLRALVEQARPPAPLDRETRARLRRRLLTATAPRPPLARTRANRDRGFGVALLVALFALCLLWLAARRSTSTTALPLPDPDMGQKPSPPAHSLNFPDPSSRNHDAPPSSGERWYPVRNKCSDGACTADPACCTGPWDEHCDDLLLEAARLKNNLSGGVGRCYYHDRETCPECACSYYLKVGDSKAGSVGWDQGTGCLKSRELLLSTLKAQCAQAVCE